MHIYRSIITSFLLIVLAGFTSACGDSKTEEQRMSDAATSFDSGKYREALIELKNLLQDNPKSKDARVLLARASLRLGDANSAEKELERAAKLGATDNEIYGLQQQTWLKLGKYQEFIDNYAVEKATAEERAEMQLAYGKALNGLDKVGAAKREFQSLADSSAGVNWQAEGLVGLAQIARASGDDDAGKAYAEKALATNPESASAFIVLGQIALARGEYKLAYDNFVAGGKTAVVGDDQAFVLIAGELESAIGVQDIEASKDAANRLFALAPEHPITNYLMARVAYISGDKEMAHERIQKVLSTYPEFLPAQFLQGLLSIERKEYPQAEMFLSNVVAAQPANFSARKMLAEANMRLGNSSEAANILREGIKLGAGEAELTAMLGIINLRLDGSGVDVEALAKTLEANPGDEQTRLALIATYIASGQAAQAEALIEASDESAQITPERKAVVKLIAAMQAKDNQATIAQADLILSTWPDNPRTSNMIGGWFASQEMFVKARKVLESGYANNPDDATLLASLSRLDNYEGKSEQAEARIEEYLVRNPNVAEVWVNLAALHASNDRIDVSASVLERARAALPDEYLPSVVLTRLLLSQGRLDEALKLAEQVALNHEKIAAAQFAYGRALFEVQNYDLALEYLKRSDSLESGLPATLLFKARSEAKLQRFAQARKSYQQLWEVSPGNLEAARSIALLELRKGNNADATKIVQELRELRPDDVRVDIIDADVKAERGNNKAAFDLYEKAYAQRPSRDVALKLSRLAQGLGQEPEDFIRRWLEQTPDDVGARLVLAQTLQQGGRSADAIDEYESIIVSRPNDGMALNNLAWLYFESSAEGSRERALKFAKRAYEQNPNNPQIADTYGWVLFKTGQIEQGKNILALADTAARAQKSSDARDITYHYAAALSESGDRAGARSRLKSILSDSAPFYSREDAQRLFDSLAR